LNLDEIGRLTDKQIHELYYHERDEATGEIVMQAPRARADTLEDELLTLDRLNEALPGGIKDLELVKEKVTLKWQAKL
jgi:hypothetical protein